MKKFFILALIATGCMPSPKEKEQDLLVEALTETTAWDDVYTGMAFFTEVPETDYIMVPIGQTLEKKKVISYSVRSNQYDNSLKNYVFCNLKTGEQHLLIDSCGYSIESAQPIYFPYKKEITGAIFYFLRNNDSNGDGVISYEDTRHLYISESDGRNFRPVTPPDLQVENYYFPNDSTKVILSCVKDTDKDGRYTDKDRSMLLYFDWPFNNNLKQLFSEATEKSLQDMVTRCTEKEEKEQK